jgi:LysR family transcriptional regulator, carnitine catabolism transcriptional activator
MANLPVRHIMTFVCLAESGTFRRAAERLKLSQPAVSAHIRDLEAHFGVPLVQRTTRRVSLTAEGEALAARARRAFEELEMASQDLRDLAAAQRGRVVVACIPPMMAAIVPSVARRLADEFPAIEVEIRDVLSGQVEQLVDRGEADFGIGPQPKPKTLSFRKLMRDDFVAAVPSGHPLGDKDWIGLEELLKYPLVTTDTDANARTIFDRAARRHQDALRPRFELVHNFSVGRLVAIGLGVTVLPRSAIPSLGTEGLHIVELKAPRIFREIGVMSRPNYRPSPSARIFLNALADVISREVTR